MKNFSKNNFSGKKNKEYKKKSDFGYHKKNTNRSEKNVWELHQRLRHVHFPLKSKDLHLSVVNEVKAKSQSKSLSQIEHLLNSNEIDLIRRARNKIKRYPKSSDPTIYSRATGFETLIGWLFLKDPQRLSTLFEYLEINNVMNQ